MRKIVIAVKARLQGTALYKPVEAVYRSLYKTARSLRRVILQVDKAVVREHFARQPVKKLHLGCGNHIIEGWLNSDYFPYSEHVLQLDVSRRFPFADGSFDRAFSEHMIEHIPHAHGQHMLNECFRVMKPNGKVRITTPDLAFLIALFQDEKTELQKKYIRWTAEASSTNVPFAMDTYVINNFVRDWGHQFIYDEKALRASLQRAGFQEITRCNLNESSVEEFRNLENETKIPEGFLRLESFTLEGTKRVT
jgi:predicted SAM-dependent methyltransferase